MIFLEAFCIIFAIFAAIILIISYVSFFVDLDLSYSRIPKTKKQFYRCFIPFYYTYLWIKEKAKQFPE